MESNHGKPTNEPPPPPHRPRTRRGLSSSTAGESDEAPGEDQPDLALFYYAMPAEQPFSGDILSDNHGASADEGEDQVSLVATDKACSCSFLPSDLRRRQSAICSMASTICLIFFFSVFLVMPRVPAAWCTKVGVVVGSNRTSSDGALIYNSSVAGKFTLQNHNFVDVSWSGFEVGLYWVPATNNSSTGIPISCSGSLADPSQACDPSFPLVCTISLGEFKITSTKTAWRETAIRSVKLEATRQQTACIVAMNRLGQFEEQALLTRGSASTKSVLFSYDSIDIRDTVGFAQG